MPLQLASLWPWRRRRAGSDAALPGPVASPVARRSGGAPALPAAAAAAAFLASARGTTLDPAALDPVAPERFYLPAGQLDLLPLADCTATVAGSKLRLHSQVLCANSGVLRGLFLAQKEGGVRGGEVDLSSAFQPCCLPDVTCLLRLLYCPEEATGGNFGALAAAGRLPGVVALAHRLSADRLLAALEAYLQGITCRLGSQQASLSALLGVLAVAQQCGRGGELEARCLEALADRLAAAGKDWATFAGPSGEAKLAALDAPTLAALLRRTSQRVEGGVYRPPPLLDVSDSGASGGFTFCLPGFAGLSKDVVFSPWVELGGCEWRLAVSPRGDSRARRGKHLSVFLCVNVDRMEAAGLRAVVASGSLTALEQRAPGGGAPAPPRDHAMPLTPHTFARAADTWGYSRFVPLRTLRRIDRAYLAHDRLLLRAEVCVERLVPAS